MSDEITPDVFEHLVELAALELSPKEGDYLRRQLNNQLKAIHELEAIPLSEDVPPARHGVTFPQGISPEPRPDKWIPFKDSADILREAPQTEDGYIVVPEIPHTTLE